MFKRPLDICPYIYLVPLECWQPAPASCRRRRLRPHRTASWPGPAPSPGSCKISLILYKYLLFIVNNCQLLSTLIPCYACSDLWGTFDFLVNQKVKYCEEWEGDDVHEDKIHPGHVNLQRIQWFILSGVCLPISWKS